jgi:hypothetical protein
MQDNQMDHIIVGLAPADKARLPPSTITKKYVFICNQPSLVSCFY